MAETRSGKLKVYGVNLFVDSQQHRCVVAAHSQAEAARLFRCSINYLRNYGSETGNTIEVGIALNQPGQIFGKSTKAYPSDPYVNVTEKSLS